MKWNPGWGSLVKGLLYPPRLLCEVGITSHWDTWVPKSQKEFLGFVFPGAGRSHFSSFTSKELVWVGAGMGSPGSWDRPWTFPVALGAQGWAGPPGFWGCY